MIFESAINSKENIVCIVIKGPTGCGKGYLFDKLSEKYEKSIRISEIETLPSLNNLNDNRTIIPRNSLFPSLSFSKTPATDNRKVVSRLTDAHFFQNCFDNEGYFQIRKLVEMLKTNSGIVFIEFTDFEFEGSINNYILKVLKETFSNNFNVITLNSCSFTTIKKTLEPLNLKISNEYFDNFNGDSRALIHDLYLKSLSTNSNIIFKRDFKTDFFHYVGKLLYPSKSGLKIFEDDSSCAFWDLDFNLYLTFLQYYFPIFLPDLKIISSLNDSFCTFDNIPWKVLRHVSIENYVNSCKYAPVLSCFQFINNEHRSKIEQKFFSFTKPPPLLNFEKEIEIKKKCKKLGIKPEEFYLKECI